MTTGTSQASTSSAQLSYLEETAFGVVGATAPKLLRNTGEDLTFGFSQESSAEINATRQISDAIITDAEASGGFQMELSYLEYDPFIEALLGSTFNSFGTGGVKTITGAIIDATAGTLTGGAGSFTGLVVGQYFSIKDSGLGNDGYYRIGTVSATVITVDTETPFTANETANLDVSSTRITNGTATMRTFSIEKAFTDVGQYFMHRGRGISQMDLNFSTGSILTGSFGTIGKDVLRDDATQFGSAADASNAHGIASAVTGVGSILVRNAAGTSILGGAYINSATMTINGALRAQKAIGNLGAIGIGQGTFEMTGSLEIYLKTGSIYDAALADQKISVVIPTKDPLGNGYAFTFANVKLGVPDVSAGSKDQDVLMSVPFTAVAPNTSTDRMIAIDRYGDAALDS